MQLCCRRLEHSRQSAGTLPRGTIITAVSRPRPMPVEKDSRGILDPWLLRQRLHLTRYPVGPELAGLVDRFWAVQWDLPAAVEHSQQVLTHPGANLSVGHADVPGR